MPDESDTQYQQHLQNWQTFIKASFYITGGIVAILVLMAIFLL